MRSCKVRGCGSRQKKTNNGEKISFHPFPKDEKVRMQWFVATGRTKKKYKKSWKVCSKHFPPECFIGRFSKRPCLKIDVVPTLNLQSETNETDTTSDDESTNSTCSIRSNSRPIKQETSDTKMSSFEEKVTMKSGDPVMESINRGRIDQLEKKIKRLECIAKKRFRKLETTRRQVWRLRKINERINQRPDLLEKVQINQEYRRIKKLLKRQLTTGAAMSAEDTAGCGQSMSEEPMFVNPEPAAAPIGGIENERPMACRGCLAVERPLRPLERAAAALYGELVGASVSVSDMYPKFVCLYCRALLLKFKAFREMCRASQSTLLDIHSADVPITLDLIKFGVTKAQYPKLKSTHVQTISLNPKAQNEMCESKNKESKGRNKLARLEISSTSNPAGHLRLTIDKTNNDYTGSSASFSGSDIHMTTSAELKRENTENVLKRERLNTEEILAETSNAQNYDILDQKSPDRNIKMDHDYSEIPKEEYLEDDYDDIDFDPKHDVKGLQSDSDSDSDSSVTPQELLSLINKVDKIKSKRNEMAQARMRTFEKNYNFKIVELSKEEQIKQVEERKNSLNYKKSFYKCDMCYHVFTCEITLKNHMVKHDPSSGEHVCEICRCRYPLQRLLTSHINKSHGYDYICNECGVVNKQQTAASVHYKWHKGIKYDCKICGKFFDKPTSVLGHMHLAHDLTETCLICDKKCIGKRGLVSHMQFSHKEAKDAICSSCNTQFYNDSALQRHLCVGCDVTRTPCTRCGEGFTTQTLLRKHKHQAHSESYTCRKCMKEFDDKKQYIMHCYHEHRKRQTPKEKEKPKRKTEKNTEKNSEKKTKVYICDVCGYTVKGSNAKLQYHHRDKHTNERPYQCDYCQRRYALKGQLLLHIMAHMSKIYRNAICRYCNKCFSHNANRDRHEKAVHKKITPHKCHICGKAYNVKITMLNHIKHTHLGMPWPKKSNRPRGRKQQGNASEVRQETSLETDPSGNGEEQSFEGGISGNDLDIMFVEEVPYYEDD